MDIDGFLGAVLEPGDKSYEVARQIWNGDIQRRPAAIARCTGTADVMAAVRFARAWMPVAVRGGGHAVAGHALCDDGLVIDLSAMSGVRVDPMAGKGSGPGRLPVAPRRPRDPGLRTSRDRRDRHPYRPAGSLWGAGSAT